MSVWMCARPQANLEKSMAELSYLGSLLGLPNMLDPSFPAAFSQFFGGPPAPATVGEGGAVKILTVQESNVRLFSAGVMSAQCC